MEKFGDADSPVIFDCPECKHKPLHIILNLTSYVWFVAKDLQRRLIPIMRRFFNDSPRC